MNKNTERLIHNSNLDKKAVRLQQIQRKKFNAIVITTIIAINIAIITTSILTNAQDIEPNEYATNYVSIEIEYGDNLWNIASEYKSNPNLTTKESMKEIISLNQLSSDQLYEGQYIIVPMYSYVNL